MVTPAQPVSTKALEHFLKRQNTCTTGRELWPSPATTIRDTLVVIGGAEGCTNSKNHSDRFQGNSQKINNSPFGFQHPPEVFANAGEAESERDWPDGEESNI